jgi:DNA-directed RNA polymerase specialized sigma24 family protein
MTEWEKGEPFFVPLTERMLDVVIASGLSPEDEAIQREELSWAPRVTEDSDDEPAPLALPPALERALDEAIDPDERFALRAHLGGASQRAIAQALGISQPSVWAMLRRSVQRVRLHQAGVPLPSRGRRTVRVPGG